MGKFNSNSLNSINEKVLNVSEVISTLNNKIYSGNSPDIDTAEGKYVLGKATSYYIPKNSYFKNGVQIDLKQGSFSYSEDYYGSPIHLCLSGDLSLTTLYGADSYYIKNSTNITISKSKPSNQYYFTVHSGALAESATVNIEGGHISSGRYEFFDSEIYIDSFSDTGYYVSINPATINNASTSGKTYELKTSPGLTDGYLYINAGYIPSTKIKILNDPLTDNSTLIGALPLLDFVADCNTNTSNDCNSDYYTKTNTGYGVITKGRYTGDAHDHYIKAGSEEFWRSSGRYASLCI